MPLVIRRIPGQAFVVRRRHVVRLDAVGNTKVFVKVSADGGPEATVELAGQDRFPLCPGVKLWVSSRVGFQVAFAIEAPRVIAVDREELLTAAELQEVRAGRGAGKAGAA